MEDLKKIEDANLTIDKPKSSKSSRWTIIIFVLLLIGLSTYFILSQNLIERAKLFVSGQPSTSTNTTNIPSRPLIDTSKHPLQINLSEANVITKQGKKGTISFYPVAEYSISAEVKSATNYTSDLQSEFIPTDLALAWGDLVDQKLGKGITYSQSGRWYFYVWDSTYPGDPLYIKSHSSNHHIVPADDVIKEAVLKIKKGQKVKIDGYLINVDYRFTSGESFYQNSSMTREDTGDGACELVYVTKLQVEDKVYE